jgi:sulfoxide reductase heme-binding subunit YedZ
MAGLFAFFYGSSHLLIYVIADRFAGLDFPDGIIAWSTVVNLAVSVAEDIYERPFITVGFAGFVCMVPLALTSTAGMIRRLGRRWQLLHRLVYVTGIAGVVHFWWLVKADVREPQLYAAIIALLLGFRLWWARARVSAAPQIERAIKTVKIKSGA